MLNLPSCTVSEACESRLRAGQLHVFDTDVQTAPNAENGDLCIVCSEKGRYLGTGFYNDASKLKVQLVSRNANDTINTEFWQRRVRYALSFRKTVFPEEEDFRACRLIFGDSDGFPGLTVDRFSDVLVSEVLSAGMERCKDIVYEALIRELRNAGETVSSLYERNDNPLRELEGLPRYEAFYQGEGLTGNSEGCVLISENGLRYCVDYLHGQKTGFFLDQKLNRRAIRPVSRGKRVLDCFTHTGSFALNALAAGAVSAHAVDISGDAVSMTKRNAELNGFSDRMTFTCADVFDFLDELDARKQRMFDLIVLDPPAFTKSSKTVNGAYGGYREINRKAMKILPRGGFLATASCSHYMPEDLFCRLLREAAFDANVTLKLIESRKQSPDHPILWNVPETQYLKFFLFQIV